MGLRLQLQLHLDEDVDLGLALGEKLGLRPVGCMTMRGGLARGIRAEGLTSSPIRR